MIAVGELCSVWGVVEVINSSSECAIVFWGFHANINEYYILLEYDTDFIFN